jgi:putative transposase
VLFKDEASLSNTATVSYGWSLKGVQPEICQPQRKRERRTLFGAMNPRMGDLLTSVEERGNTATFFRFLRKCISANKGRKVYLVVDNVRFHHARRLQPILERYRQRLELVFLPPYSPDLNLIERVWWADEKTGNSQSVGEKHAGKSRRFSGVVRSYGQSEHPYGVQFN